MFAPHVRPGRQPKQREGRMQKKLTKQVVDNAPIPEKGDAWIWDTELQGFGLRIKSSGRKIYVVRYRTKDAHRTQRKMTVCRASDATPDKARALAREIFMSVAAGNDPAAERRPTDKPTITLEAMFTARVEHMRKVGISYADEVERVLLKAKKNAADALGRNKAPSEVTPADIVKFVSQFYKAGHRAAADKARGYISSAYSWAIASTNDYTVDNPQDWGVTVNPAAAVAKDANATTERDRNLSAEEIREVWNACQDGNAGFSEGVEVCLRMIIACGQRVRETLRIEGREIDLDEKLWKMPAAKTKGRKRPHVVPLPDCIIPDLRRLKEQYGDGPLFPARADSKTGIIREAVISHAVHRWVTSKECPIEAFQPRDLRRTWKSRAHDAGVDRFTRDLIQQHAKSDTGSKHYDRADYLPQMREAMDKWNAWLTSVLYDQPAPETAPPTLRLVA